MRGCAAATGESKSCIDFQSTRCQEGLVPGAGLLEKRRRSQSAQFASFRNNLKGSGSGSGLTGSSGELEWIAQITRNLGEPFYVKFVYLASFKGGAQGAALGMMVGWIESSC